MSNTKRERIITRIPIRSEIMVRELAVCLDLV